jgi:hypothetical protein
MNQKLVKDFKGNMIPRAKARKIDGEWYEEGTTVIKMEDGQWYRVTTNKIVYDWELGKYVLVKNAGNLVEGLVDDGTIGKFTPTDKNVKIAIKKIAFVRSLYYDPSNPQSMPVEESEKTPAWKKNQYFARSEEIALKHGYEESIFDAIFYKKEDCTDSDKIKMRTPSVPTGERSQTYSLEDDQAGKASLLNQYNDYSPKIPISLVKLANLIPYSFGLEFETSNGFIPSRLRSQLGVRPLRDGSIGGIEFVTIPLSGAKGILTIKENCEQLSKRCITDPKCSMHVHFGNVRRDKLYIVSLWHTISLIQKELSTYFPFSRTNSIRPDGKVYCKPLPDVGIVPTEILKSTSKEEFNKALFREFDKVYSWLNAERHLGEIYDKKREKEMKFTEDGLKWKFTDKVYVFSIRNKNHSIQGNKWERPMRYHLVNFLPTFFSPAETIEWRIHEATTNFTKVMCFMLLCVSIMKYAESTKVALSKKSLSIQEVLKNYLPQELADYVYEYLKARKSTFMNANGSFKQDYTSIENKWLAADANYVFKNTEIDNIL